MGRANLVCYGWSDTYTGRDSVLIWFVGGRSVKRFGEIVVLHAGRIPSHIILYRLVHAISRLFDLERILASRISVCVALLSGLVFEQLSRRRFKNSRTMAWNGARWAEQESSRLEMLARAAKDF